MTHAVIDLQSLTHETFAPLVGMSFEVALEEEGDRLATFVLDEAVQRGQLPEGFRPPFSLLFSGPLEPAFGQATYWLSNPSLGIVPIFLVPVSADAAKRVYQAIFG